MSKRLRVVYLDHVAKLSGAELALLRLLPSLKDVEPIVILAEDGPLVARFRAEGISCEVIPINPRTGELRKDNVRPGLPIRAVWDTLTYSFRVARRIRQLDADLIHTNSLKAHLYGGLAARLARVPQVWHTRDRIAPDYLPVPAVRLVRLAVHHLPAAVIANSNATLETLDFEKGPRRVLASPVVMNDPVLRYAHFERVHDSLTFGLVGRLAAWKGQDLFLRAFADAFPDGRESAVIIGSAMFGEDDYAATLPLLAAELGIADRVEFTGFVDDIPQRLAQMDVLVHCSVVPEPFGQVVIEGMAAGLAVIAAAAGGPAEIIEDGVTGILTPMGDAGALARAMRSLAENHELAQSLGATARTASKAYRPGPIARQLTELYGEVLHSAEIAKEIRKTLWPRPQIERALRRIPGRR